LEDVKNGNGVLAETPQLPRDLLRYGGDESGPLGSADSNGTVRAAFEHQDEVGNREGSVDPTLHGLAEQGWVKLQRSPNRFG
jgi:hypothetical protein